MCLLAFLPKLDVVFLQEVESARTTRSTYGEVSLTWELMVDIARGKTSGDNLLDKYLNPPTKAPQPATATPAQPSQPTPDVTT